jgi:hypothetical protein
VAAAAVGVALGEDAPHLGVVGRRAEEEVDEARAGDLDLVDERIGRQCGQQLPGHLARLGPGRLGQQHRRVAGEIAVFAAARALHHEGRQLQVGGEDGLVLQGSDGLQQQVAQRLFHGVGSASTGTGNPSRGRNGRAGKPLPTVPVDKSVGKVPAAAGRAGARRAEIRM